MTEKDHKQDFGLPMVDSTPMNIVNMEGNMFRGIVDKTKHKTLFTRVVSILFCLFFMILPPLAWFSFILYFVISTWGEGTLGDYFFAGVGFLFMGSIVGFILFAGIKGVLANIKK